MPGFNATPLDGSATPIPMSSAVVPGDKTPKALQGGPAAAADTQGNVLAPASMYVYDGNDETQGKSTDANTANTVMGRLTKLRDIWLGLIGQQVKSASVSVTIASDQGNIPISGTVTANVDATNSAHIANTDTATAIIATQTTTTATNTGNIFTRLANVATMVFDNTDKLRTSLYVKTSAAADTILTLGRTTKAGSLPVTMASDQDAIAVSGIFWQATQPVSPQVASSGGGVPYHNLSAAATNFTNVKGAACQLYDCDISNTSGSTIFVKFYDKATAPGTGDVPKRTIQVPANGTVIRAFPNGLKFTSGFGWAATGAVADNDNTAIAANCVIDFDLNS